MLLMPHSKLPSKLLKEPLIDVVFELRFSSKIPGSAILPGLLFPQLPGASNFEALPASQLPPPIRDVDQNLQFAPLSKFTWDKFLILIGDRSIGVGCIMPYAGWSSFRAAIEKVVDLVLRDTLIQTVERYSLKYVDFFETNGDIALAINQFDIELHLGKHALQAENAMIRVEIPRSPYLHAVQVVTTAMLQISPSVAKTGAILDVDTLSIATPSKPAEFLSCLPQLLDGIHQANKEMFFECLSKNGLNNLEPQYE